MKMIILDIDETICTDTYEDRYEDAKPLEANIKKANQLYDAGHYIMYWTSRGHVSGVDWTDFTREQLEEWGVKYHDLRMGKPYYDLFICDKAISSENFFDNMRK